MDGGGAGSVGTRVERTTYGQYERCSFRRSNWRWGVVRLDGGGDAGRSVITVSAPLLLGGVSRAWAVMVGGGMNAHSPTRR